MHFWSCSLFSFFSANLNIYIHAGHTNFVWTLRVYISFFHWTDQLYMPIDCCGFSVNFEFVKPLVAHSFRKMKKEFQRNNKSSNQIRIETKRNTYTEQQKIHVLPHIEENKIVNVSKSLMNEWPLYQQYHQSAVRMREKKMRSKPISFFLSPNDRDEAKERTRSHDSFTIKPFLNNPILFFLYFAVFFYFW